MSDKQAYIPIEVEIGDKIYQITIPQFQLDGELVTAEEASENPELLDRLLEMGFGGLKEVV